MSYACRNCGTTIMEDDENLCSKCKPAESAPAPREDARELADKLLDWGEVAPASQRPATLDDAAAEIERYVHARIAAAPKTVPMAMLEEIAEDTCWTTDDLYDIGQKYGCTVTESGKEEPK